MDAWRNWINTKTKIHFTFKKSVINVEGFVVYKPQKTISQVSIDNMINIIFFYSLHFYYEKKNNNEYNYNEVQNKYTYLYL